MNWRVQKLNIQYPNLNGYPSYNIVTPGIILPNSGTAVAYSVRCRVIVSANHSPSVVCEILL